MSSLYSFITGTAESLAARSPPYSGSFTAASFSSGRSNFFTEEKRGTAFTWTSCWSSWRQRLCSYFSDWETETSLTWIWQCVQRKATGWGWNITNAGNGFCMGYKWVCQSGNGSAGTGVSDTDHTSQFCVLKVSLCSSIAFLVCICVSFWYPCLLVLRQSVGMPVGLLRRWLTC